MKAIPMFFCFILFVVSAFGQNYKADNPQSAVSGEILPVKTFAIETGFGMQINSKNNYAFNYNETLVRIGMMKLMEMTVGFKIPATLQTGVIKQHNVGFASPKLGLKVLMKEKNGGKMGLAFVGEAGINFGSKNYKDTKVLPAFRVAMDVDLSDNTNLRVNYGAEWKENRLVIDPEGNPVIDPFFVIALNLNQTINEKWMAFVEIYANVKHNNFRNDYNLNGGMVYRMKDNMQVHFAAGAGLSPKSPRGNLSVGFAGLWPEKNMNPTLE
jgi:hypothetical protein